MKPDKYVRLPPELTLFDDIGAGTAGAEVDVDVADVENGKVFDDDAGKRVPPNA